LPPAARPGPPGCRTTDPYSPPAAATPSHRTCSQTPARPTARPQTRWTVRCGRQHRTGPAPRQELVVLSWSPLKIVHRRKTIVCRKKIGLQFGDQPLEFPKLSRVDAVTDLWTVHFSFDQAGFLEDFQVLR